MSELCTKQIETLKSIIHFVKVNLRAGFMLEASITAFSERISQYTIAVNHSLLLSLFTSQFPIIQLSFPLKPV